MGNGQKRVKVALESLGCKLNQAETELMARQFADAGYKLVSRLGEADVYILNTCTVTHIADRKCRQRLRQAHRQNPDALVVATGCYAERASPELAQTQGVNLVFGNEQKSRLLQVLEGSGFLSQAGPIQAPHYHPILRTRSFIKIQDGCDSFCAYCIVPLVRGRERSLPAGQVINEIRMRTDAGYKEVVLTGVRVGSYNYDGAKLRELLEHILAETKVARLRLSSLQPQEISPELIRLWHDTRLCRHFHLSLQSGSQQVLERMKRHYSTSNFAQTVSLIRESVPGAAITTDIIVGFPGESDEEFQESYDFCRQMEFARIHVFPYSPRQGTKAAQMPRMVAGKVKKERSQQMLALAGRSANSFRQRFLGKTMAVLWEKQSGGIWTGLTDNYIKVYTRTNGDLTNKLLPVKLVEPEEEGVWGERQANSKNTSL